MKMKGAAVIGGFSGNHMQTLVGTLQTPRRWSRCSNGRSGV